MSNVLLGLLFILVGALFAFRGYLAMRVIIPIWGAFAGFMLGAGLGAEIDNGGFLTSLWSWAIGIGLALLFGLLAYLYYEVSVIITMTAIGFALGASLMVALGVTWSWLTILVGVLLGAALALLAIIGNLPMVLLTVLTALAGASAVVAGTMLMVGTLAYADLTQPTITERINDGWWWTALYVGVAAVGIVVQMAALAGARGTMRQAWDGETPVVR